MIDSDGWLGRPENIFAFPLPTQNYVAEILIKKQAALSQKLKKYLCCITVFLIEDE